MYTCLGGYGIPAIPTNPNYCRLCGYSKDAIPSYCYSLYILYIIIYIPYIIYIAFLLDIACAKYYVCSTLYIIMS